MSQCPSTCRKGRCALVAGHITPHYTRGYQWPNDTEPAQTRPTAPVAADTAPAAMTVPGNGTEALSAPDWMAIVQRINTWRTDGFPPPTVPRCDGCKWWTATISAIYTRGECRIARQRPLHATPMLVVTGGDAGHLAVRADHYCAAHEPATKEPTC